MTVEKTFYNKATIEEDSETGAIRLFSYNTLVAEIKGNKATIFNYNKGNFSNTTIRHIREFFRQGNFSVGPKAYLLKKIFKKR